MALRPPNRRAFAAVCALHALVICCAWQWQARRPAIPSPEPRSDAVLISLPKPPPPPPPPEMSVRAESANRGAPAMRPPTIPAVQPVAPPPTVEFKPVDVAPIAPAPDLHEADVSVNPAGVGGTGRGSAGTGTATGTGTGVAGIGNPRARTLIGDCNETLDRPIVADVYRFPDGTNMQRSAAEISYLKPIQRICFTQLSITPRSLNKGVPGVGELINWFALDIRFTVNIAEAGTWDLMLLSDDGAILTIDGVDVLDTDGLHKPLARSALVKLAAGIRQFRIRYFQGPVDYSLILAWRKPGEPNYDFIPRRLLGRPPE